MRNYNIESDLKQEQFQTLKLVQGDRGNKIKINVYEDGQPVSLTGCSVTAKYKRADGEIINDGVIENIHDNSFDAVMDSSITKVAGTLKMLFTIEKDDVKVSTFLLLADVRESIGENTGSSGGNTGGGSGEVAIDLSNYYKKNETYSKNQIDARFKDNVKKLDLLSKYKTYKSIKEYGAISDCNYYNASDNKYYKDSNYTQLATYNDEAFLNAFNSGYNIIIDDGNFLLKNTIVIKKAINIIAQNGNIYMESNEGTKGMKHIFQLENEIKIDGVKFNSKNNQELEMSLREENGSSWDETHGYSSNISAINIKNSNCEVSNCVATELEFLVNVDNSSVINNLKIKNNSIYKTFIGIGMGNVTNSYIESNTITMESSLGVGTPHAIYFWGGCQNIRVSNCYLYNSANIISLMRSKGNNYKIMISNCSFECLKTKCSIGIDCVHGTSNIYIQNCTFTDCRGLINSSATGSSYINSCVFTFDNNITNNTITTFINPLENNGGGLLNVENTTFDITFYYENAIKFKNTKFRNVNLVLTVNNSINTFNKTAIETDGDVRFYNSSIISNGRYYVYGSGTYSIYNSVITSSQGSELSYLNTNYYKCIMSNSFTNTNNMTNMVDCTLI